MLIKILKKIPSAISVASALLIAAILLSDALGINLLWIAQIIFSPGSPLYFNYFFLYNCIAIIISLFLVLTKQYRSIEAILTIICNLALSGVIFCMIISRM